MTPARPNHAARISTLLYVLVLALLLLATGLGVLGLNGMSRMLSGLDHVYQDAVVPLRDLKTVADEYAIAVTDAVHKVRDGLQNPEDAGRRMRQAQQTIATHWSNFVQTPLTADERAMIE